MTDDDQALQSPSPFRIPSVSIWGILVFLRRYTLQLKVIRRLVLIGGAALLFVTWGVYGALLVG